MSHLPPNTAIFSPSIARQAASTAKDWNYVDNWLSTKFHGRPPPPFERNLDTLRALLALASQNEAADEDRELIARVESVAVWEHEEGFGDDGSPESKHSVGQDVLASLEDGLTNEGITALEAMASTALELGAANPAPQSLGSKVLGLQTQLFDMEQTNERVAVIQGRLEADIIKIDELLTDLDEDAYRPSPDLAKQNLELQRGIKAVAADLPEQKDRLSALAKSVGSPSPSLEQVQLEEEEYLKLLAQRRSLDIQIKAFQGLPADTSLARQELDGLRADLRSLTQHRDTVFEGLVERESPQRRR